MRDCLQGETKHKKVPICYGGLFGLDIRRVLELACQRQSGSLPPEQKAGDNVRKVCREQRSSLQGFLCQNFCNETAPCLVNHPHCICHGCSEDIISSNSWHAPHLSIWKGRHHIRQANLPATTLSIQALSDAIQEVDQGPELYFSASEVKVHILLL